MRSRKVLILIFLYLLSFYVCAEEEKKHYVIPAAEMLVESGLLLAFGGEVEIAELVSVA